MWPGTAGGAAWGLGALVSTEGLPRRVPVARPGSGSRNAEVMPSKRKERGGRDGAWDGEGDSGEARNRGLLGGLATWGEESLDPGAQGRAGAKNAALGGV